MSLRAIEVAARFFEPIFGGEADVIEAVEDDEAWFESGKLMDPMAPVTFVTPDGTEMTGGPFRGAAGCRAGWREWVAPWDRFRLVIDEVRPEGAGTVLVLVRIIGSMAGSEAEVVQEAAAVIRVEDGRVVGMEHYLDRELAARAAKEGG